MNKHIIEKSVKEIIHTKSGGLIFKIIIIFLCSWGFSDIQSNTSAEYGKLHPVNIAMFKLRHLISAGN